MYRPHLVSLPFPLVRWWLKVVPLLVPIGSYTRKVASVRHVMNWMKTSFFKRFKSNDENSFPGQIPRRFQVRLQNVAKLNVLHEPFRRPDLTSVLFFCMAVGQLQEYLGNLDLTPNIRRKKNGRKKGVRSRDGHAEHVCKTMRFITLQNGVAI